MPQEYRFDSQNHLHEIFDGKEWKPATGITTVLSVIAKPALIQWAAHEAIDYVIFNSEPQGDFRLVSEQVLKEARTAHHQKKEEAGQKGTDIHDEIEKIIKQAIDENNGIIPSDTKNTTPQIQKFLDWATANKVKFLESEKHLWSKTYFLGGICDFICEIDGKVWVGDIKTSGTIYPEYFWQTAGYQLMIEEMGLYPTIEGHIILNLRKDGEFAEKRSVSNEDNKEAFLACLKIYRIKQKVEGNLI